MRRPKTRGEIDSAIRQRMAPKRCRLCKCTEDEACNPPCGWDPDDSSICTNCGIAVNVLANWLISAVRPSVSALIREAKLEAAQ